MLRKRPRTPPPARPEDVVARAAQLPATPSNAAAVPSKLASLVAKPRAASPSGAASSATAAAAAAASASATRSAMTPRVPLDPRLSSGGSGSNLPPTADGLWALSRPELERLCLQHDIVPQGSDTGLLVAMLALRGGFETEGKRLAVSQVRAWLGSVDTVLQELGVTQKGGATMTDLLDAKFRNMRESRDKRRRTSVQPQETNSGSSSNSSSSSGGGVARSQFPQQQQQQQQQQQISQPPPRQQIPRAQLPHPHPQPQQPQSRLPQRSSHCSHSSHGSQPGASSGAHGLTGQQPALSGESHAPGPLNDLLRALLRTDHSRSSNSNTTGTDSVGSSSAGPSPVLGPAAVLMPKRDAAGSPPTMPYGLLNMPQFFK